MALSTMLSKLVAELMGLIQEDMSGKIQSCVYVVEHHKSIVDHMIIAATYGAIHRGILPGVRAPALLPYCIVFKKVSRLCFSLTLLI